MKNREVKNIIPACGCDAVMPFALIYLFYIILHGHLSPGGGFQGGVLMVAIVVLLALGHGYETTTKVLSWNAFHHGEGWASIFYVLVALLGVAYGAQFCQNVLYNCGNIGDIWSTGTIFLMNAAVGIKVLTGVGVLALSMFGLLALEDGKE
jgi:Multisubunit Na+/H+ antiporter, MnhB subunit